MTELKPREPLHLFEGIGVELEYMIVDAETLQVKPICDALFEAVAGEPKLELNRGQISWSNELALHVVEFKSSLPEPSLSGLANKFHEEILQASAALRELGARLLPGGMHPLMKPLYETKLWPHEQNDIYRAFDRLFNCSGHGWSNLQSTHINLPFNGDDEFRRLHAAIRVVLPLLPGLAASSPLVEGRATGLMDNRLDFYRRNSAKIPSITGLVIPEAVFSEQAYQTQILGRISQDLAAAGEGEVLEAEWVNARGAIARFGRHSIEIRILDIQESPAQDLAVVALVVELVRALVEERWSTTAEQEAWSDFSLEKHYSKAVRAGGRARIDDSAYLRLFGLSTSDPRLGASKERGASVSVSEIWRCLVEGLQVASEHQPALDIIVGRGSLAERMVLRLHELRSGQRPESLRGLDDTMRFEAALAELMRPSEEPDLAHAASSQLLSELADCLEHNRAFFPDPPRP